MTGVKPVRFGVLFDYVAQAKEGTNSSQQDVMDSLQLVIEDFTERGLIDRPVEIIFRQADGLPRGSFRSVLDAYNELVEEDCLVIYGPLVSENGLPLSKHVEKVAQVPIISMAGTEAMLNEWVFAMPNGSMDEEPIVMAQVAWYDGVRTVGVVYEESYIGQAYLEGMRNACNMVGLQITGEVSVSQNEANKDEPMRILAQNKPDAIMSIGFGLANVGINAALEKLNWMPPRYANTSFNFGAIYPWWRQQLAGWIGLDQYDERNPVAKDFGDRFEKRYGRRADYIMPVYAYDMGRVILTALSKARPLTGEGVKNALEKIKMMPAACGAPGTRIRFGNGMRSGWMGAGFLVARRYLPDGSKGVLHGDIDGLVDLKDVYG
jgi:ABC-type branched-subunit amino acid transport system substrate-binding protein